MTKGGDLLKKGKNNIFFIKKAFIWISLTSSIMLLSILQIFAEGGDQWKDFYERNSKILATNNLVSSAIRQIGWYLITKLVDITETVQNLYNKAFGFIDMTTNSTINDFVVRFKPAFIAFTALALLYLGYILIMKHDKKPNIATNICIAILCVSCSTFMFSTLNGFAHSFKSGVDSYKYNGNSKAGVTIVDENMIDVLKAYKKYGTALKPSDYSKIRGGITEKKLGYFRINSVINYASKDLEGEENPFKYRLDADNPDGTIKTVENDNGWGINDGKDADFGNEFYYRYHFNWDNAFIQLIAIIIVYIAMSYKCVRIAFELVVARLFAYLYSAELSGGEKIRKVLAFIRDSYILLCVTTICIKLYEVFTGFIHTYVGVNLTACIFSLFLAFTVIDGPNLVEKLLGMDAGLKSSTARMLAFTGMIFGAGRGVTNGARGIIDKIKNKGNKDKISGAGNGFSNIDKKRADSMNKDKSGKNFDKNIGSQKNKKGEHGLSNDNGHKNDFMSEHNRNSDKSYMQENASDRMDRYMKNQAADKLDKRNRTFTNKDSSSMPKRRTEVKSKYINKKGNKE